MTEKQLAIVAPYFGTLPAHFQLWLNSCAANPQVTWLLYTDDRTRWKYPANVIVTYCELDDLRKRFQRKFNFEIALSDVRKLGDWKPLYGYLFDEELKDYRAWGHVDVGDVVYGDFSKFITDSLIDSYDRLGFLGHLAIYRNTPENNKRFMSGASSGLTWREVFSSPEFRNFEELAPGSISDIWDYNGWTTCVLDDCIADLSDLSWAFHVSYGYSMKRRAEKNDHLVFEWNGGRLLGHELRDGEVMTDEYLYVHFKRRRMVLDVALDPGRYLITPAGFTPAPSVVDAACLKRLGAGKFPDPMWIKAKKAGLMRRLGR